MKSETTGWAALVMAGSILFFVVMFAGVYPAAGISGGDLASAEDFLPFAEDNAALAMAPFAVGIVMHLAGVVLVVGLWSRLRDRSSWVSVAAVLGLLWMAFDIAYNGIAIHVIPELAALDGGAGVDVSYRVLIGSLAALQLTGHLAGGIWLAVTSHVGMRSGQLSGGLGWLGVVTGSVFALSILGPNVLYPSFLLLPTWLAWYGLRAVRSPGPISVAQTSAVEA